MKKIFLLFASVFFSTMMFAQVLLWKDGEVIYSKNIDEVDKISFYEVEDFELLNDEIVLELYRGWDEKYKWIHAEFAPKNSYGVLEYKSSDEDVVTVTYDGQLAARGIGEATVTVKLIGTELEKTCKVTVKGYEGTIQFNQDYVYLLLGQVYDRLKDNIGFNPYCWECREELEWTSSNEKVATVDDEGNVTALKVGQAIITAKIKDTDISASTIVKVDDCDVNIEVYSEYDYRSVDMISMGVDGLMEIRANISNDNYDEWSFNFEWISTDESVVVFGGRYGSTTIYENNIVAKSVGEADVIVRIAGTEIQDTLKVVVEETSPLTVQFYDVLTSYNGREYPLGYDYDGDGVDDVVREVNLWLLGTNLNWVEEDGVGKTVGEDYFIYVPTAWIFDGTYVYPWGDFYFNDPFWEEGYLTEYDGEKYFSTYAASASYFDEYSYCKYFEQSSKLGEDFDVDAFKVEYGWPLKNTSSYIYYWNTEEDNNYMTGLIDGGSFALSSNESDRGTTNICVSYMDINLRFFDEVANGLATEVDSETGELNYKEPFEMAPMTSRYIYFDNRYRAPQQKAPAKMQGISEKALKINQLLNIPLQMKLQDIRF